MKILLYIVITTKTDDKVLQSFYRRLNIPLFQLHLLQEFHSGPLNKQIYG